MSIHAEAEAIVHELFRTEAGRRDPHPRYHRLRQIAPVHRSEALNAWVVTSHAEARTVLRDPRFHRRYVASMDSGNSWWRERESLRWASRTMLQMDPPDHTGLRKRVARTFTPRRIEELRPKVEVLVADLVDDFAESGGDLMERLAYRMPISVIGAMLGLPEEDLAQFRDPTIDLTAALDIYSGRERLDRADAAHRFFHEYFLRIIEARRADLGDDLVSALVGDDGPDPLDDEGIVDLLILIFVAGFETTTGVISAGVLALHDQPEQLELLRARPDLDGIAEELLRHSGSIHLTNRVPTEDVQIAGQTIPAGDTVFVMLGAANRDPSVFADPDLIDFAREDVVQVALGGGIHFCLGAALARMELDVLFRHIATRFDKVELTGARPAFRDSIGFQATESMPVRLNVPAAAVEGCPVMHSRPADDDGAWRREYRERLEATAGDASPEELAVRVALLESQPFFASCRPSELLDLAATAYVLTFEAGESFITQDTESLDAFLIIEGEAEVRIDGDLVATVGPDDLVGERGLITDTRRAATVRATTHMAVHAVSRDRLSAITDANPAAAATMLAVTAHRYPQSEASHR